MKNKSFLFIICFFLVSLAGLMFKSGGGDILQSVIFYFLCIAYIFILILLIIISIFKRESFKVYTIDALVTIIAIVLYFLITNIEDMYYNYRYPAEVNTSNECSTGLNLTWSTFQEKDKFGFKDDDDNVVIKPEYDVAYFFSSDSLTLVKKNGFYGYINLKNQVVIPFMYKDAQSFQCEIAMVKNTNGQWFFIDRSNNDIYKLKFERPSSFYNGLAIVNYNGKEYKLNKKGQLLPYK